MSDAEFREDALGSQPPATVPTRRTTWAILPALAFLLSCAGDSTVPMAQPSATAPGWQAPRLVADAGRGRVALAWGAHLSLALDPDGAASLAWDAPDPDARWSVTVARREAGAWGTPASLSAGIESTVQGAAAYPFVSGGARPVVAWHDHSPLSAGIWATCWRSTEGRWALPTRISVGAEALYPQLVGSDCRALATWGGGPPLYRAFSSELDAFGWSQPQQLGRATTTRVGRFLGGTIATWQAYSELTWWQGGRTGVAGLMGGDFFAVSDDSAERAPEAVLVWDGGGGTFLASRYGSTAAWTSPQALGGLEQPFRSAAVANSSAGAVFCVASAEPLRVRCARAETGHGFGALEDVARPVSPVMFVDVAIDTLGRSVVAYATIDAGIYAARTSASGAWSSVQRLDQPAPEASYWEVRVRADGAGRLLAAWMSTVDRTAHTTIWTSAFEP